ncbi:MAG: cytochrome c oxidase subunit 3 [Dehalococcoidia bacterium]|nr:cytochrome c oxidase subunit 3 [Dehalococcoidia bacterium]
MTTAQVETHPHHDDEHRSLSLLNRKTAMWVFLGSECLFFGSLLATYLSYRGRFGSGPTPEKVFDIPFTSVSAFVLLFSSLMMVLALAALQRGNVQAMRVWLIATAVMGMIFLGGQVYEFTSFYEKNLTLQSSVFGATFYVLTGFHGAHVTVGVLWLLSLVGLSWQGRIRPENALDVEVAGLYWHFVDIVWIVIFTVVYLIKV